jgi:orotate phosphoribosyltransferase-like protein
MTMSAINEEIQEEVQSNTERLRVLITSDQKQKELVTKLENLDVDVEWHKIAEPLTSLEDTFTFRHLKPVFEAADKADIDLVIAVDSTIDKFTLGVRKIQGGNFVLFNIHHTALILSKLLLENHGSLNLKKSIFISDLLDKLFARYQGTVTTIANLTSPTREQDVYLATDENDTLYISENQEIVLKGQNDSLGYLLSRIVMSAKKAKGEEKTLFDSLIGIYNDYGFQREKNMVVSIEEPSQKAFFKKIIAKLKKKPPLTLGMTEIISIEDLSNGTMKNLLSGRIIPSVSPPANALQILLGNNTKILIFPTEQKINFFFTTQGKLIKKDDFNTLNTQFDQRVLKLLSEINRLGQEA